MKGRSLQEEETERKMGGKIIVLKCLGGHFKMGVTDIDSSDISSGTRIFKRTAMSIRAAEENRTESAESTNWGGKPLICEFGMPAMRIQNLHLILYLIPEIEPMYKIQPEKNNCEMEKLVEQPQHFCLVIPAIWSCAGFKSSISSLIKNRTSTSTQLIKRLLTEEVKTRNEEGERVDRLFNTRTYNDEI